MEFVFIVQSQLTEEDLEKIIALKKTHWNYCTEEHKNWIINNIKKNDIHVLMLEDDILVGYLNLVKIDVVINNTSYPFLGIGNVCSKEKGKGYGKKMLIEVNNYLIVNKQQGILLCKEELIVFYIKCNWKLANKSLTSQLFPVNINVMLFNFDFKIISFNYTGGNF